MPGFTVKLRPPEGDPPFYTLSVADLNYTASVLLERALPTFYRDTLGRTSQLILEKFWEGLLRVQDADYASLFTVDRNKSLETLEPFTFQPLAYQPLEDWQSNRVPHAHEIYELEIPPLDNNNLVFKIQGVWLEGQNQLFLAGGAIPSRFYTIRYGPWLADDALMRGTIITVAAEPLINYLAGLGTLDTYGGTLGGSTWFSPGEPDPDAGLDDQLDVLLEGNKATILANRPNVVATVLSNGTQTSFDVSDEIDIFDLDVYLDSVDITDRVTATYLPGEVRLTLPPNLQGKEILVTLGEDGSDNRLLMVTGTEISIQDEFGTAQVRRVTLFIDFKLGEEITFSGTTATIVNQSFLTGAVKVRDGAVVQSRTIGTPVQAIDFGCPLSDSAELTYYGVPVKPVEKRLAAVATGVGLPDVSGGFSIQHPAHSGSTIRIVAPKVLDHKHEHFRKTLDVAEISVSIPSLVDEEWFPYQVHFNGQLANQASAVFSNGTLSFLAQPAGTILDVYYQTKTTQKHKHFIRTIVDQATGLDQHTVKIEKEILEVTQVYENGLVVGDDTTRDIVNENFITFTGALTPQVPYLIHTISAERLYTHEIEDKREDEWGYRARLNTAEELRNGIEKPTITLLADAFDLGTAAEGMTVATDVTFPKGWWVNSRWDEQNIQNIWGEPVGIVQESSSQYARLIAAIYAGIRGGTTVQMLENFSSIILGSNFLSDAGKAAGVRQIDGKDSLRIEPADPLQPNYEIELLDCFGRRDLTANCLPRFYAVNEMAHVFDSTTLDQVPWVPLFAEKLAVDYRFADRLDSSRLNIVVSVPFSFDRDSNILRDFSIDFNAQEVQVGDLIRADLGILDENGNIQIGANFLYSRVAEIVDAHSIRLSLSLPEGDNGGYGGGGYGSGPFGGLIGSTATVGRYVIYTRRTQQLDTGRHLDRAEEGFDGRLVQLLKHHSFALRLDWAAMTDCSAIENLTTFLDHVVPAASQAFVYTEAFQGNCYERLSELVIGFHEDGTPVLDDVSNALTLEESHIGLSEVIAESAATGGIYGELCDNYGPNVVALACTPDPDQRVGEYYIAGSAFQVQSGPWSSVYSFERGLEHCVLRVTSSGFTAGNNIDRRQSQALSLENEAYIEIDPVSSISTTKTSPTNLEYVTARPLMVHLWAQMPTVRDAADRPILFQWGPFRIDLVPTALGTFTVNFYSYDSVTPISTTTAIMTVGNYFHIAVTHAADPGGYYVSKLYVNGDLQATSGSTVLAVTAVPAFSDTPIYLGGDPSLDSATASQMAINFFGMSTNKEFSDFDIEMLGSADLEILAPIGLSSGQPMSRPDHTIAYQFHSYYPYPVVTDYSGNAYNALVQGNANRTDGIVLTRFALPEDRHQVQKYYVDADCQKTYIPGGVGEDLGAVTDAGVTGPDGQLYPVGTLITRGSSSELNGFNQHASSVVYARNLAGDWDQIQPVACPMAAIGEDDSDWYLGFV